MRRGGGSERAARPTGRSKGGAFRLDDARPRRGARVACVSSVSMGATRLRRAPFGAGRRSSNKAVPGSASVVPSERSRLRRVARSCSELLGWGPERADADVAAGLGAPRGGVASAMRLAPSFAIVDGCPRAQPRSALPSLAPSPETPPRPRPGSAPRSSPPARDDLALVREKMAARHRRVLRHRPRAPAPRRAERRGRARLQGLRRARHQGPQDERRRARAS